jgi:hypothetical protein
VGGAHFSKVPDIAGYSTPSVTTVFDAIVLARAGETLAVRESWPARVA